MSLPPYDPLVAQIAGTILASIHPDRMTDAIAVRWSVQMARAIIDETHRTAIAREQLDRIAAQRAIAQDERARGVVTPPVPRLWWLWVAVTSLDRRARRRMARPDCPVCRGPCRSEERVS